MASGSQRAESVRARQTGTSRHVKNKRMSSTLTTVAETTKTDAAMPIKHLTLDIESANQRSYPKKESPSPRGAYKRQSPSPRGISKRESPSPRGFNIRDSPSPQVGGSFSTAFRVIRPRHSPRTTVSLDAVDLWEEEDDVTEGEDEFDEINGVLINPSKTFDLSELRRSRSPVACKRNKVENKQVQAIVSVIKHVKNKDKEVQDQISSLKDIKTESVKQGRVSPRRMSSGRVSPGKISPGRVSPSRVSQGRVSPGRVSPGRVSPGRRKSPRDVRPWKPRPRIAGRNRLLFPTPEQSTSEPGRPKTADKTDTRNSLAKAIDGRLPVINDESQNPRKSVNCKIVHDKLSAFSSKTDFSLHRLREEVEMVSDSADEMDAGLHSAGGCGGGGGERKVTFNELVRVREGQSNTTDSLRNSNNSAHLYKKQFLLSRPWGEET